MWGVRRLYRAGSLTAAARELERYKLGIAGVQGLGGTEGDTVRTGAYHFF